ncbi:hypothetical protein HY411_01410 [Candidatus Gottesmanbacteria bacterium]|nr:hypothetical protein [Candidatus Gottesmanbacteria bacterium]
MLKIERTGLFEQTLDEMAILYEGIDILVEQRIVLFRKNSNDSRLDNHPLRKSMEGRWAFWVNDDIRIVYKWLGKATVRLLVIGAHEVVYQKKLS